MSEVTISKQAENHHPVEDQNKEVPEPLTKVQRDALFEKIFGFPPSAPIRKSDFHGETIGIGETKFRKPKTLI